MESRGQRGRRLGVQGGDKPRSQNPPRPASTGTYPASQSHQLHEQSVTFASAVQSPASHYKELSRNRLYDSFLNLSYKNIHAMHGYLQLPPTSRTVMLSGLSP